GLKDYPTGSEDSRQNDCAEERFGTAPETAIFEKESGVGAQRIWLSRVLVDDVCLQDQIKEAVDRALRSLAFRGRVLDRDHLIQIAIRINEQAVIEKDQN